MRLLFNQNISFRITKKLQSNFKNCFHVSDCGLKDSEDSDIWRYAKTNGFTIVTFDADFYDISILSGHPPKIIWIKEGNQTTNQIAKLMISKKSLIHEFIENEKFNDLSCLELE